MATVEDNGIISIMKYNNVDVVDISIRVKGDDSEVLLMHKEVIFLCDILNKWLDNIGE